MFSFGKKVDHAKIDKACKKTDDLLKKLKTQLMRIEEEKAQELKESYNGIKH